MTIFDFPEMFLFEFKVSSMQKTTTIDRHELRRIHEEICDVDQDMEEAKYALIRETKKKFRLFSFLLLNLKIHFFC